MSEALDLSVAPVDMPDDDMPPPEPDPEPADQDDEPAGADPGDLDAIGDAALDAVLDLVAKMLRGTLAPDAPPESRAWLLEPDERRGIKSGARLAIENAGVGAVLNENAPAIMAGSSVLGYVTRSQAEVRAYRRARQRAEATPPHPNDRPAAARRPAQEAPRRDRPDPEPAGADDDGRRDDRAAAPGPDQPAKSLDSASLAALSVATRGGLGD